MNNIKKIEILRERFFNEVKILYIEYKNNDFFGIQYIDMYENKELNLPLGVYFNFNGKDGLVGDVSDWIKPKEIPLYEFFFSNKYKIVIENSIELTNNRKSMLPNNEKNKYDILLKTLNNILERFGDD